MKKITLILTMLLMSAFAFAELTTGEQVARAARDRDTGDTMMAAMEMILIDGNGNPRPTRAINTWAYTYDKELDLSKVVMEFVSPASIRGTRFLTVAQPLGTDDDKWIYLPDLKRVRRIASADKGSSFVGSDFSYGDMETREVEEDTHKLLGSEVVNGYECYVIESIPVDMADAQYSKRIVYVTKEHYVPMKAELYNKRTGELEKVMKVEGEIKQVQDIWTIFETVMTTVNTGHSTVLKMRNDNSGNPMIKYNVKVDPRRFTQEFLETGRAR